MAFGFHCTVGEILIFIMSLLLRLQNCANTLILNDWSAVDVTADVCYQAGRRDCGLRRHTGGGRSRGEL